MIAAYYILPETENRSLEDIEIHFSDNQRKLTDINIRKQFSDSNTSDVVAITCDKPKDKQDDSVNKPNENKVDRFCYTNEGITSNDEGENK